MDEIVAIPYHYIVRVGDIVKLPSGAEGEVVFVDVVFRKSNPSKIVFVEPDVVWWLRWILWFSGHLWYCDREINKLVLLAREDKKGNEHAKAAE